MAKGPPSQRYGTPSGRFWRNVVLIALAHVALIAGLIRWSVAARASSNPESIVWLGGAGDLSADESEKQESPSPKQPPTATESSESEQDEAADEKPVVTTAKSEIELPSATPKPTATATPAKPSATPALRAKIHSKTNPETNSQENAGGESFSKTGDKTQVEPSKSERQVGEKRQNCSGKKGFRVSERKRAKRINRQSWQRGRWKQWVRIWLVRQHVA